jgi:MYXO-CTERM domain-containing protein
VDTLTGSPDSCNVGCQHVPITQCAAGDGCCPSACSDADDADCPAGASEEDSGCGCATVGATTPTSAWLLLLGLPALGARGRRRRNR